MKRFRDSNELRNDLTNIQMNIMDWIRGLPTEADKTHLEQAYTSVLWAKRHIVDHLELNEGVKVPRYTIQAPYLEGVEVNLAAQEAADMDSAEPLPRCRLVALPSGEVVRVLDRLSPE